MPHIDHLHERQKDGQFSMKQTASLSATHAEKPRRGRLAPHRASLPGARKALHTASYLDRVRRMRTAISLLLDCCCGCCCVNDWRAGPSSQRYCKLFGATILMASVNASELPLVNAFRSA